MSAFKRLNILGNTIAILSLALIVSALVVLVNYTVRSIGSNLGLKQSSSSVVTRIDTVYVTVTKEVECTRKHVEMPKAVQVVSPKPADVETVQIDSTAN